MDRLGGKTGHTDRNAVANRESKQIDTKLAGWVETSVRPLMDMAAVALLRLVIALPVSERAKRRFKRSLYKRTDEIDHNLLLELHAPVSVAGTGNGTFPEQFYPYQPREELRTCPRVVAFYLPQFHPFAENDEWWGKGFTEWTNVTKAKAQYDGHHQPHLPIHLGFYDLRLRETMQEQAKLAAAFGIGGFAYYYYWFNGKTLMETPLDSMLLDKSVNMPFCLIWANESWTRRWNDAESTILVQQAHSLEDSRAFFLHVSKFFRDERYIRVDGKPVLAIYRKDLFDGMAEHIDEWRKLAVELGFPGVYLICVQTAQAWDPQADGFDAAMGFPPHCTVTPDISEATARLSPEFSGTIYDYESVVTDNVRSAPRAYKYLPAVMLSWDNTARRGMLATIFARFTLQRYAQWLAFNVFRVAKDDSLGDDEKIVFVNAWNEWAEGAHLEPDRKYGFGYLEATRGVLENLSVADKALVSPLYPAERHSEFAVIVHLHFESAFGDVCEGLDRLASLAPDLYFTVTSAALARKVGERYAGATIEVVENRGRDILPFVHVLGKISSLGYVAVCKVHGKVSAHLPDGPAWRNSLLQSLLKPDLADMFTGDKTLGLVVPAGHLVQPNKDSMASNRRLVASVSQQMGIDRAPRMFPAGSMFWFRPEAMARLLAVQPEMFDVEKGLIDGTVPHAIERLFCAMCETDGYRVATCE